MTDRRRRQKEQRADKRQTEKKQKARKELRRRLLTAGGFGLSIVALLALGTVFSPGEGELASGYERYLELDTACDASAPPPLTPANYAEPEVQADISKASSATATIATSCGDIIIDLNLSGASETVNSFVFLARSGFYDGQVFHRVVADFLVQTGDPNADGNGSAGYKIKDEYPAEDFVYTPGIVAMHNVGKGTTGSQFFIVTGESAKALNPSFNVLGTVIGGQDTLDRIESVETGNRPGTREQSRPEESVFIESITIEVAGS